MIAVLSIADLILAFSFGMYFHVGYFADKTIFRIASDLAFIEGALVFCAGAFLAFLRASVSAISVILMITGGAMLGLSVLFGAMG